MTNWTKKDQKYIWHPYTQMKDCQKNPPILIEKAKGIKLFDDKGNFYYDTISSWWCNVHGHNHPRIKQAIKSQLEKVEHVLFAGFTHKPAIELAEKLISISPKTLKKVFYSDNGSTAVEVALKLSFQYWKNTGKPKKEKFIFLDLAYHGDTIGAMSVSGVSLFNRVFSPLFFKSFKVPSPYCYRCPMETVSKCLNSCHSEPRGRRISSINRSFVSPLRMTKNLILRQLPLGVERKLCNIECIKPLENLLKKKSKETAGIILEPIVMAAGGMIVYPKEYLKMAAKLCKKYDVHLILDEVATGFGRTGKMFACEHANVMPDFMCLSKGITSGCLPFAATLTTDEVYRAFYADYNKCKTFYHGHTYTANPIGCAAALASLKIFEEEDTLKKSARVWKVFHNELEAFRSLDCVGDVRYIGGIGALELVKNRQTKEHFTAEERIGQKIYKQGLKNNLILRPLGNIVYFFLPLCVKDRDVLHILREAKKAISVDS